MEPLIEASDLLSRRDDPRLRVLDARFELLDPAAGRRLYRDGHVPGALFVDLDEDLSSPQPPGSAGGRHPLPDMRAFVQGLGARGVGDEHEVVVYDQGGSMFAARAWWMLRYVGHGKVRVLDGGFRAFLEAGGEPVTEVPSYPPAGLSLRLRPEMRAERADVRARLYDPAVAIVDARAPERYRGETEPLDPRAGHIPSALNLPYERTFDAGGRFLPAAELRERLAAAVERGEVISYCGSGVSAAHNVLALEAAGVAGARLYVGSWSDWCSAGDAPIALGDEPAG
ncbi:MAG TPA: sulfurtransferase [Trueperaceae bacterium]|nr:sulfurtransferase [Trueperaceae bacterium]